MFLRGWQFVDRSRSETKEKMKALRHHRSLCSFVGSGSRPSFQVTRGVENCSNRPFKIVMMNLKEDTSGLVPFGFLISLICLDHFSVDPAFSPIRATGHHLVTLCRSICAEEGAQILDLLMGIKYLTAFFMTFVAFLSSLYSPVHRIRCRSSTFETEYCTFWSACC